jgi:para-aminobenzoate synthetase
MPHAIVPRILFIDAYDSFSNNVISLIQSGLDVEVTVIKIDEKLDDLASFLRPFAAVIAGPGPGHPGNPPDVGLFNDLWALEEQDLLPVLGICLGFQSLAMAFGGKVEALPEPRHGILRKIRSNNQSIFKDICDITAVQYHSLHAIISDHSTEDATRLEQSMPILNENNEYSQLQPLAWDFDLDNQRDNINVTQSANPTAILMAVVHNNKPFFGIQFHPESICSNTNAQKILPAWWSNAQAWNQCHRDLASQSLQSIPAEELRVGHKSHLRREESKVSLKLTTRRSDKKFRANLNQNCTISNPITSDEPTSSLSTMKHTVKHRVLSQSLSLSLTNLTIPSVCRALKLQRTELIVLESELHQRPEVGTHSIIGIVAPTSLKLEYEIGGNIVRHLQGGVVTSVCLRYFDGKIFSYLKHFMKFHQAEKGNDFIPFWGGLMGFINYEASLETIGIRPHIDRNSSRPRGSRNPDMSFVFVERSIVIDHQKGRLYVQSIRPFDNEWVSRTISVLNEGIDSSDVTIFPGACQAHISLPDERSYKVKIRNCQKSICAGDAYELCLTTQSTIRTSGSLSAWPLYLRLRKQNPAPFSAYVRLGHLTLLSSSPERFLRWSRPAVEVKDATSVGRTLHPSKTITCQFRPIKGTVNRIPKDPTAPLITLAQATAILATPKERAENLMIVDLIRHDLHGVVGSGNVQVRKLMVVEEYATLYQLVTVIEGTLYMSHEGNEKGIHDGEEYVNETNTESFTTGHIDKNKEAGKAGIDILAASLPPGSMTGAPKRRACQILHALEDGSRGIYSGVLGYLDVGGGGDFSVVIRSAFRWDSAKSNLVLGDTEVGEECSHSRNEELDGGNHDARIGSGSTKMEPNAANGDTWHVGAGGAVTSLSTENGEWEEMRAKMKSTMGIFDLAERSCE